MPSRLSSLAYLAWRAVGVQPVKKLAQEGSPAERFEKNYAAEGLVPTTEEDRAVAEAASACVACGVCEARCELMAATPHVRALGLHTAFRLYSKSTTELPWAREALQACARCDGCDSACPTGVPIQRVIRQLLERLERLPKRGGGPAGAP
ncbi:4Fe-4S dicluster domain-containing protein [Anaeromyxobacter paludicola]|uniref:4Fe-4S ferredoxin-type domain-containing protein n=1 Tax=Anaeromyxobacter paludicola TaxID=2918171 RepID=A0ABM7X5K8_9BACT|nr:4Fe-4S dicluster domain-containing protein [Anaeromyxobacter paludicola]BDG07095.1 hypothetical protein AMPC_02080 [Anaeromyxobacter paludicola]